MNGVENSSSFASYESNTLKLHFKTKEGAIFAEILGKKQPTNYTEYTIDQASFNIVEIPQSCQFPEDKIKWLLDNQYAPKIEQRTIGFEQAGESRSTQVVVFSKQKHRKELRNFFSTQENRIENQVSSEVVNFEEHYYECLLQAKRKNYIEEQIYYIEKIGNIYFNKQKWVLAAKIYNQALAIIEKEQICSQFQDYFLEKLQEIETRFLESRGIRTDRGVETIQLYRNQLKEVRKLSVREFNGSESEKTIERITLELTSLFKQIMQRLIETAQQQIGGPSPTNWAAIGMGSMARNEMCLYSDVEFAFLIEEKTEDSLHYFRLLSQLLEIKMINFGETAFPIYAQLFGEKSKEASPTPNGFCMDSGGNTPLGKQGIYELIDTPEGLAQYQSTKWVEADIILTNALSTVCYLAGDQKLVKNYNKHQEQNFNKKEGSFFKKTSFREKLALKLLEGNLSEFKPNLSREKEKEQAFGIKKELYRPIQSILGSLALYYKLKPNEPIIDQLLSKKIISQIGAENLNKVVRKVLFLRFKAHVFYETEEEFILHANNESIDDRRYLYFNESMLESIQEIYKTLIPFHRIATIFFETKNRQEFANQSFYDESPMIQGLACEKSLQFTKAREFYQQAVSLNPSDVASLLNLNLTEVKLGTVDDALTRGLKCLELTQSSFGNEHENVALSYNILGHIYSSLHKYAKALRFYQQALAIWTKIRIKDHPDSAICYGNIGLTYYKLKIYDKALAHHQMSLEILLATIGQNTTHVANAYNNIGLAQDGLEDFSASIKSYEQSLKIRVQIQGENHPDIAPTYNNLGCAFETHGQPKQAIIYYQKATQSLIRTFGEIHPDIALIYNNLGSLFNSIEDYANALVWYKKAEKIALDLSQSQPLLPTIYGGIAGTYLDLKQFDDAFIYHQKYLKIRSQEESGVFLAKIYYKLAEIYEENEAYEQAIVLFYESSMILTEDPEMVRDHPFVATCYNNMGSLKIDIEKYEEAIDWINKALAIWQKIEGKEFCIATTYDDLGRAHRKLGNYQQALDYHNEALKIRLTLFEEDHTDIGTSYNNLGNICKDQKQFDEGMKMYAKSFEIFLRAYQTINASIEVVFNSLLICAKEASPIQREILQQVKDLTVEILGRENDLVGQLEQM